LCFPVQGLGGEKGYTGHDILCETILECCTSAETCLLTGTRIDIVFTADDAVPGSNDVDWKASDNEAFETSLATFGEKLITGIKA
jgi:hypothetical protein